MKVAKNNYEEVMERIHQQRWNGYEFVVFSKTVPASMDSMIFCFTAEEAKLECTQVINHDFVATRTAYRVMGNGLNDSNLLRENDGLIDVAKMIEEYHNELLKKTENELNNKVETNKKGVIMNLQEENLFNNLMYVDEQVYGVGVADTENRIESIIASKEPKSEWEYPTSIDGVPVKVTLNFSKSQETDYQFFNNYSMEFKKGDETVKHTFYINKKQNLNIDEAFKLMNGRAIRKTLTSKEGQRYNVWFQLDQKNLSKNGNARLNKYHDAYGFDHGELLKHSGIKDVDSQLYNLMSKMENGERVEAVKEVGGEKVIRIFEANLPYKALNVYGEDGKLILKECISMSQIEAKAKMQKQDQTQQQHSTGQGIDQHAKKTFWRGKGIFRRS